jgi:hypothetical protein
MPVMECSVCERLVLTESSACQCGCQVLIPLQRADLEHRLSDAGQAMRRGISVAAGGIIFTLVGKRMAEAAGTRAYWVLFPAVAYGAVLFVKAFARRQKVAAALRQDTYAEIAPK